MDKENIETLIEECNSNSILVTPLLINTKYNYCGLYSHHKDIDCKYLSRNNTKINGIITIRLCYKHGKRMP